MIMQPHHQDRIRQSLAMFVLAAATLPAIAQETIFLQCEAKASQETVDRSRTDKRKFRLTSTELVLWNIVSGRWGNDKCHPPEPGGVLKIDAMCKWDQDTVSLSSHTWSTGDKFEINEKILINKKTGFYSRTVGDSNSTTEYIGRCEPIPEPIPRPRENTAGY